MNKHRREFLKQVGAWSAGAAFAGPLLRITPELLADEAVAPVVSVAKGKDYQALVTAVLKPLGGIEAFVRQGQKVVVKPNIGWDRKPELAANTHPQVVLAVVKAALAAGAAQVMVFDRSCNDARKSYASSGIQQAVEAIGDKRVTCPFMEDRKYIPIKIEKGQTLKQWALYKDAVEADAYINVPIAKHHSLAKLTLGLKNIMGIMGDARQQIHKAMAQSVADLNTVVRPKLTIIDATRILIAHGPQGGKPEDVKELDTLIASADTVAADAYAATLFALKPADVPIIAAAAKMGLGEMDLGKIKVVEA
jgi:uncharacterized protein (DUF362 family)